TVRRIDVHEKRRRRLQLVAGVGVFLAAAAAAIFLTVETIHYKSLETTPYELSALGQTELKPGTNAALRVRLVNRTTRFPLGGVPVDVELRARLGNQSVMLASFATDAEGTGQPQFKVPEWADGRYDLCVTAHTPTQPELLTQQVTVKRSWKLMLSSDK